MYWVTLLSVFSPRTEQSKWRYMIGIETGGKTLCFLLFSLFKQYTFKKQILWNEPIFFSFKLSDCLFCPVFPNTEVLTWDFKNNGNVFNLENKIEVFHISSNIVKPLSLDLICHCIQFMDVCFIAAKLWFSSLCISQSLEDSYNFSVPYYSWKHTWVSLNFAPPTPPPQEGHTSHK